MEAERKANRPSFDLHWGNFWSYPKSRTDDLSRLYTYATFIDAVDGRSTVKEVLPNVYRVGAEDQPGTFSVQYFPVGSHELKVFTCDTKHAEKTQEGSVMFIDGRLWGETPRLCVLFREADGSLSFETTTVTAEGCAEEGRYEKDCAKLLGME